MPGLEGWSFPVEIDKTTGKIKTVSDNACIKQGIDIILRTNKGERILRPSFGTDINDYMFANVDLNLVNAMSNNILRAIDIWEEHIHSLTVNVKRNNTHGESVVIEIDYITDISPMQEHIEVVRDLKDDI